jgi:hypothetical protein
MPLKLPVNDSDKVFIVSQDSARDFGALTANGYVVTLTSSDPNTVDFSALDSPPQPAPSPVAGAPAGATVPSDASATVTSPANPAQPNVPITVTAAFSNPDPTQPTIASLTDTVTVSPGSPVSEGILFGAPVAVVPAPVSATEKAKADMAELVGDRQTQVLASAPAVARCPHCGAPLRIV